MADIESLFGYLLSETCKGSQSFLESCFRWLSPDSGADGGGEGARESQVESRGKDDSLSVRSRSHQLVAVCGGVFANPTVMSIFVGLLSLRSVLSDDNKSAPG